MGYSVHASKVWGTNIPAPCVMITSISRVVEKSAAFTCLVLQEVLDYIKMNWTLQSVTNVCFRSDSGPHYRCVQLLSCCAFNWMAFIRQNNGSSQGHGDYGSASVSAKFGPPHHCKGDEDRYFGVLSNRLKKAETARLLASTDDLLDVFRTEASKTAMAEHKYQAFFIDMIPKVSKELCHD